MIITVKVVNVRDTAKVVVRTVRYTIEKLQKFSLSGLLLSRSGNKGKANVEQKLPNSASVAMLRVDVKVQVRQEIVLKELDNTRS